MNILLAPNALKSSLSAAEAADAMRRGILRVLPEAEIRSIPIADGGDGLVDSLAAPLAAVPHSYTVNGPLGTKTEAKFLYVPARRLAIIEMARASGLALLDGQPLDALAASSSGSGELILAALDLGCTHIVLGIGGSATTDAGTGLATALGARFLDRDRQPLTGCGRNLAAIEHIDLAGLDPRLHGVRLDIACDVDNPLLGERGAAQVYGPQKGASDEQLIQLEAGLTHFADILEQHCRKDIRSIAGAGAAGGMGGGLVAMLDASLRPGAQLVLELLGVEPVLQQADLVLTCEGRLDGQTRFGKAPAAVAALAQHHDKPCIGIAGSVDASAESLHEVGFSALFSLCPEPVSLPQAIEHAAEYMERVTEQILRCLTLTGFSHDNAQRATVELRE